MKAKLAIISLLLAGILTACVQPLEPWEKAGAYMGVVIEFPELAATKGVVGNVTASDAEIVITDLRIWVFRSGTHELVAYRSLSASDIPTDNTQHVRTITLSVSREFANRRPDVDLFVLANTAAIGSTLGRESSYDDVDEASFGDGDGYYSGFGLSDPVHAASSDYGLPFSGVGKNLHVQRDDNDQDALSVNNGNAIQICRAVSRVRFVFCRVPNVDPDHPHTVSIDQVMLDGGVIPLQEYVFTTGTTGVVMSEPLPSDNYDARVFNALSSPLTSLATNYNPEALRRGEKTAQQFEADLQTAIDNNTLTDKGYTYFRESDKRLTGSITYTVDGVQRSRDFQMAAAGDFARNHTWIVYAYFAEFSTIEHFLDISISVTDWEKSNSSVNTNTSVTVDQDGKFFIDPTGLPKKYDADGKSYYEVAVPEFGSVEGSVVVYAPLAKELIVTPVGINPGDEDGFIVATDRTPAFIDTSAASNKGRIKISVSRSANATSGQAITLSFSVKVSDTRTIDANSEIIDDRYRFVIP